MFIGQEIKELETLLLAKASLKEKYFYYYLDSTPLPYPSEAELTEIQKICLSLFCTNGPQMAAEILKLRKSKPIKGMHYANNLIELFAFALDDEEAENTHINEFCKDHSTRDFFVINDRFSSSCLHQPQAKNEIDQIALYLNEGAMPENWKPLFMGALKQAADLIDLFVLNKAYILVLDDHPIAHKFAEVDILCDQFTNVLIKMENRIRKQIALAVSTPVLFVLFAVAYWAIKYWDQAEPIIFVVQGVLFVFFILVFLFTGVMPNKIESINQRRERIIDWRLGCLGIDRHEMKTHIKSIQATGRSAAALTRQI